MTIRQLTETMINQIAAGEIVERPASVVKELIENSVDAGATRIDVATAGGGKTFIRVSDNGYGIAENELVLAISRHCTSKLAEDIHDIHSLGFRGEALPSIGSVSRLRLLSRTENAETGSEILVAGGRIKGPCPAATNRGTVVEVCDLFYATPARLKFMKTDRAEAAAITDVVRRIAIAFPHIRFSLSGSDRRMDEFLSTENNLEARIMRLAQILGKEFVENTVALDAERERIYLSGFAGIPSYNRANNLQQFAYVNGRPIRDKMISGAIRAAYDDTIARNRHGVAVLFIEIDPCDVDVNVHPAKSDVRFRDPGLVRGLIIGSIRDALEKAGIRTASPGATAMLDAFQPHISPSSIFHPASHSLQEETGYLYRDKSSLRLPQSVCSIHQSVTQGYGVEEATAPELYGMHIPAADPGPDITDSSDPLLSFQLGAARAQIHQNYIVAQTKDSLIIVDQHAAHERLVYEKLKTALYTQPLASQMLLVPEIVELPDDDVERLLEYTKILEKFGLVIDGFGSGAVVVRGTPAMLGEVDTSRLVRDLVDEIAENNTADCLKALLDHVAATMACHGSVRSGRILKHEEMNALLRQMEMIPATGTCNHGRPTYIELKLADIERLFGRR